MRLTRAGIGFLFWSAAAAQSQQYVVSSYAAVPRQPDAFFGLGIAADAAGNVYFSGLNY